MKCTFNYGGSQQNCGGGHVGHQEEETREEKKEKTRATHFCSAQGPKMSCWFDSTQITSGRGEGTKRGVKERTQGEESRVCELGG